MKSLEAMLAAMVDGDLDELPTVLTARHADLLHAAEKLPQLVVSRPALIGVLNQWRDDRYTAADVQQWASFVRHGFAVGSADGPIRPIDIVYEANAEESIVETIGRLTEIGDRIDGVVDHQERERMLKDLEKA